MNNTVSMRPDVEYAIQCKWEIVDERIVLVSGRIMSFC